MRQLFLRLKRTKLGKRIMLYKRTMDVRLHAKKYAPLLKRREQQIGIFVKDALSPKQRKALERDMLRAYLAYGFDFDEYFVYEVEKLSDVGREAFLTERDRYSVYSRLNRRENLALFDDKEQTYRRFQPYYKSELCAVRSMADADAFAAFTKRHRKFILKPIAKSGGKDVRIVDADAAEIVLSTLLAEYADGFVAEELIRQSPSIAKLHPYSVNTVRITTILCKDSVGIVTPFFRIGQKKHVVDNGMADGILAAVDMPTGIVTATIDEKGNSYIMHPDTGEQLIGFRIPRWEEAVALAKELAQVVPENRFTGWDLALTDDGWVMVEGNARGQFVGQQMPSRHGIKREVEQLIEQ